MLDLSAEAHDALRRHVVEPMVGRCVDREYGGFIVDFDERWRRGRVQDKTLEHAARTTLAFAWVHCAMPEVGCDRLVRHGCSFLQEAFWDDENGGFFAKVARDGRPLWDGMKHPHGVTYVAMAFLAAEPYLSGGEGLLWAHRALAWLDDVAWDRMHGGYWGSYRRTNERYPDGSILPTPDGRDVLGRTVGLKEANTLGDAIEMLTMFVKRSAEGGCAERLAWLIELVMGRLTDDTGILPYLYRRDWKAVPDAVRMGQQFQMIHRIIAGVSEDAAGTVARASALMNFALASGRHPRGGFSFAVSGDGRTWPSTGSSTDLRQWWVQLEAVRALHALAEHPLTSHDARVEYRRSRDEQWKFIRTHFFDNRRGGIFELPMNSGKSWRARLSHSHQRWTGAWPSRKTHGWKDPFHEVGTFLAVYGSEP